MAQTSEARLKLPELDTFLDQLRSRWSREACSVFCTLEPGSDGPVARAIFDGELAALSIVSREVQHTVRTLSAYLGAQRNRFCKVNNLPVEILREILLSVCECGLRWRDLASILETCKQWYHVLSHDPSAYSTINVGDHGCSLRLAECFARKSTPRPLRIAWADVGRGTSVSNSVWEAAFCKTRLSRIKSLEFVHWDLAADKWLLESPAPELERCKLSLLVSENEDEGRGGSSTYFEARRHIFPHLFGGNAPKLRALDFHQVRMAWCPSNYSNLTHIKITMDLDSSALLARIGLDSDDVTVVFRESPGLEHVELVTRFHENMWAQITKAPNQDHARPKCIMRHLHTLRLHLLKAPLVLILGAIEITPTITTIDIRSDDDHGLYGSCLEVFRIGVLPDFLFAKLTSLSIGYIMYDEAGHKVAGLAASGSLHRHQYFLRICLPHAHVDFLGKTIALGRFMPELRHIEVADELSGVLIELLAASPAADAVDIRALYSFKITNLRQRLQVLDHSSQHSLSRVSHWGFLAASKRVESDISTDDICALTALFKLPPSKRRTFSIEGCIQLGKGGDLCAMRTFVMDLARLGVAIVGPVKFGLNEWDYTLKEVRVYTSMAALWTSSGDEVPDIVQEVMATPASKFL